MLIYSTFSIEVPNFQNSLMRMHLFAIRSLRACISPHYALSALALRCNTLFSLSRARHSSLRIFIFLADRSQSAPAPTPAHGVLGSWHPDTSLAPGVERRAFSTSLRSRRLAPSLLYISLSGADGSPPPPTGQQSSPSLRSMWSHDSGVTWAIHLRGTRDIPLLTPALLQFCASHSCLCLHSPKVGTLQTL